MNPPCTSECFEDISINIDVIAQPARQLQIHCQSGQQRRPEGPSTLAHGVASKCAQRQGGAVRGTQVISAQILCSVRMAALEAVMGLCAGIW